MSLTGPRAGWVLLYKHTQNERNSVSLPVRPLSWRQRLRSVDALRGAREAFPIVLGYVPIGFAYGVLGRTAGLPLWAIVAMSVVVYAGSAQFIAVSLIAEGASAAALVATTFLVNLRHMLYGSALAHRLASMSRRRIAWLAAELTDESFVLASRAMPHYPAGLPFGFVAGLNGTAQLSWIAGSFLGAAAGSLVGDPLRLGLDYALVAMFLGLLALQTHGRREVATIAVAGGVSLLFQRLGTPTVGVIVATLAASGVGLAFVSGAERRAP
ncbi:MAG: AzlC family ABC transporter permease [Actinobacteria bacterium]|nr:AzlC family ABC transporter permease [Actinomycetota bacterium]